MHETSAGPSEGADGGGHSGGGGGEPTPLQSRAHFLENWDWPSVTEINRGLCQRGGAQHGLGRETHAAVARRWEEKRGGELTLGETFDFLQSCHRGAPFLFFNGNTFAEIGRALVNALFFDVALGRRKELASAVAHFITGVLDRESMRDAMESLTAKSSLAVGDRVRTLKGSLSGVVVAVLEDGRVRWQADTGPVFLALPDSLLPDE